MIFLVTRISLNFWGINMIFPHFQISLPFQYVWFCQLFKECANLVFFITTGVKFRPATNNPYLQLSQSDDEEEIEEV